MSGAASPWPRSANGVQQMARGRGPALGRASRATQRRRRKDDGRTVEGDGVAARMEARAPLGPHPCERHRLAVAVGAPSWASLIARISRSRYATVSVSPRVPGARPSIEPAAQSSMRRESVASRSLFAASSYARSENARSANPSARPHASDVATGRSEGRARRRPTRVNVRKDVGRERSCERLRSDRVWWPGRRYGDARSKRMSFTRLASSLKPGALPRTGLSKTRVSIPPAL